ncbi:MAG: hypothetical protein M0R51_15370 [Clostridia bacterium]|jgi:hypothetical protein|nr:hypothetical protein [Clostridia bacterium]
MSTRSLICMQIDDDKYEAIYCHSDGYLTYNGAMLLDHYSDKEKLQKLLELGNISCLQQNIEPDPTKPHSFDYSQRQDDVVVAYGRDRGEENQEKSINTLQELKDWDWIEFIYIFDKENKWKYLEYPFEKMIDLKEGIAKIYKKLEIKQPKGFYGFWTFESIKQEKKRQQQGEM